MKESPNREKKQQQKKQVVVSKKWAIVHFGGVKKYDITCHIMSILTLTEGNNSNNHMLKLLEKLTFYNPFPTPQ